MVGVTSSPPLPSPLLPSLIKVSYLQKLQAIEDDKLPGSCTPHILINRANQAKIELNQ